MRKPAVQSPAVMIARSLDSIESPRLAAFVAAISEASPRQLSRDWEVLAGAGVPLVERVVGDRGSRRVTFVWRPRGPVRRPAIYTPIADPMKGEFDLIAAAGGVWWRSFVVPNGTRAMYAFSRTAAPGPSGGPAAWARFTRHLIADPWNPERFRVAKDPDDPADVALDVSVLSLPGAPPRPSYPSSARPRLRRESLRSAHLPGRRSVWVNVPWGGRWRRRPEHLVIAFDGVAYQSAIPTPAIVRDLVDRGVIGPTAVVLVGNALHARDQELSHNPRFVRFLVDELLPWLRTRHGIDVPAERTVLAGSSLGGLAAAHAALEVPERFGNVLAQSGAFLWHSPERPDAPPALAEEYSRAPRARTRFYLDAGQLETLIFPGMHKSLLDGVREFRDILRRKGYAVRYVEFRGGHDYACWAATFSGGLEYLIGRRLGAASAGSPRRPPR